MDDCASEFGDVLRQDGLILSGLPVGDGTIHRVDCVGDRKGSKNGWYVLFLDGIAAGSFGNWKTGVKNTWCVKEYKKLTQAEQVEYKQRTEKAKIANDELRKEIQAEAAEEALRRVKAAKPANGDNPYLKKKNVPSFGLLQEGNNILIPLRNGKGRITSTQIILPDGQKFFQTGGVVQGSFFRIGDTLDGDKIYVTEGYATGATIHIATKACVYIALNAGNLFPVAKNLRSAFPTIPLVIAADNDAFTEGNPGLSKANEAASRISKCSVVSPSFSNTATEPTDYNDLQNLDGIQAVKEQLQQKDVVRSDIGVVTDSQFYTQELPLSDLGNCERLVAHHKGKIMFCPPLGKWFVWDGQAWGMDTTGAVERLFKNALRAMLKEAAAHPDFKEAEKLMKFTLKSQDVSRIRAALRLAQTEPGMPVLPEQLDSDPWLFNLKNGTLDLKTGLVKPHDPADKITKILDIEYHPGVVPAPTWKKFLERVTNGDKELQKFLQKAVGYALTGITTEQCLFYLYGSGRNGKSTFLETIFHLIKPYAKRIPSETLMVKSNSGGIPNDVAMLDGHRFIVSSEVQEGARLNEAKLKELTGCDTITARYLHREFFEFIPVFKLFVAGNYKPQIHGTDLGIWRRIRLIPFTAKIQPEEIDPSLPDKLKAEMVGILSWAVEGCLMWQKEGLTPPEVVIKATDAYRVDSDLLGSFLGECCVINPIEEVASKRLYETYRAWTYDNGHRGMSSTMFGRKLAERGFERGRNAVTRTWIGINCLNNDTNDTFTSNSGFSVQNSSRRIKPENTPNVSHVSQNDGGREVFTL